MPAWLAPLLFGAGVGAVGNWFSARSANKFSERMSSTAHQREVKDMQAAGINPMMSAHGSGASSPQGQSPELGEGATRGASSGLAAQQAMASIALTKAQTRETDKRADFTEQQIVDIMNQMQAGKFELIAQQVRSGALDIEQKRRLMPYLVARAKEEVGLTTASASAVKARAALDQLAREGALNEAEFQKLVGEAGPWMKILLQLIRRR